MGSFSVEFVGAVEAFDELLKRAELFRNRVEVLESDNLFMKDTAKLNAVRVKEENTCSIRGIAIGNKSDGAVSINSFGCSLD